MCVIWTFRFLSSCSTPLSVVLTSQEYWADRLETKVKTEGVEVSRSVSDLVEQMWSAAMTVASVSSSQISRTFTDLPSTVPHGRPIESVE